MGPVSEMRAKSYRTQYIQVNPGLYSIHRDHQWGDHPESIIDVIGDCWGLGFVEFEDGLLSFARKGREIPVVGRKCVFIPPFSVFESRIAGGSRRMQWTALVSFSELPSDIPRIPLVFDAPSGPIPSSFEEVFAIIREAMRSSGSTPIEIGKEERSSAVAFKAKAYLDRNFREAFTIKEMAAQLHFSHGVMARAFKKCFGISPVVYRSRMRLITAGFLMMLKNMSVSDAAIEVGFSSLDHFTRQFRRWMKALPSEYIEGGDAPKAFG